MQTIGTWKAIYEESDDTYKKVTDYRIDLYDDSKTLMEANMRPRAVDVHTYFVEQGSPETCEYKLQ